MSGLTGQFPSDAKVDAYLGRLKKQSDLRAERFFKFTQDLIPKSTKNTLKLASDNFSSIGSAFPHLNLDSSLDWVEYRSSLYGYISSVIQNVLEPVAQSLETAITRSDFEDYWTREHHSFIDASATVPSDYVRDLPQEVFAKGESDSGWITGKKFIKRAGSAFSNESKDQHIPLRNLSSFHFDNRISEVECSLIKSVYKSLAEIFRPLETALGSWNRSVLSFDVSIDDLLSNLGDGSSNDMDEVLEKHELLVKNIDRFDQALAKASASLQEYKPFTVDFDRLFGFLEEDIFKADTFLAKQRATSTEADNGHTKKVSEIRAWQKWLEEFSNYYRLSSIITRLRTSSTKNLDTFTKDFLQVAKNDVIVGLQEVKTRNDELRGKLDKFATTKKKTTASIGSALSKWQSFRNRQLNGHETKTDTEESDEIEAGLTATPHLELWKNNVQALPESLRLHRSPQNPDIKPGTTVYVAEIRRWVEQSFDSILLDRFRAAPAQTAALSTQAKAAIRSADEIVDFGISAAKEELEVNKSTAEKKKSASEFFETAKGIIDDALDRSDNLVDENHESLSQVGPDMNLILRELKALGWKKLLVRFGGERKVDAQLAGMKDMTAYQAEKFWAILKDKTKDARLWMLWLRRKGLRKAWSVIRYGKGAFGIDEDEDDEILYSTDFYKTTEKVVERLPLVYRHLFSLKPVDDAAILDGRENDINKIKRHLEIWRDGVSNAIILVGTHGSGMTSYLNVVEKLAFEGCDLKRIFIQERIRTEREFCKIISKEFGFKSIISLNDLRDKILSTKNNNEKERVCIVENLEHLFLRTPSGMSLIEEVLVFFSQTDDCILWVGTIGQQSWQLVDRLSSKVGDLLVSHNMENVTRENLEQAIMNRHGRSGLAIEFVRPNNLNPLVRRRLISANTPEEKQKVLRDHFFDGLHKEAEENFTLAIVYWLNSLRMEKDDQVIKVLPLKKLNFSFLDSFDSDRAFALKAFLEHASLSVAEHSEIFGVRDEQSRVIFESFANLNLIEHFGIELGTLEVSNGSVDVGLRYRIRPLLVHPVNKFLRDRNIIH